VGVVPELVVPVRVTGRTWTRRPRTTWHGPGKLVAAAGAVVILAFVVTAALRQALLAGSPAGRCCWSCCWSATSLCDGSAGRASGGVVGFAGRKGSWRSAGARRTAASCDPLRCGVTSAVGSSCASPMVRRSRCCWDDRPACRSPTPSPASGTVVDRLPQFGTHSERGSHEKDHRLDDGVHRRVLRGA